VEKSKENKYISRFFPEYVRDLIEDPGLDEKIKNLTPEKIEKTINMVLGRLSARLKAGIETCIHCGLCSDACAYYLSNDRAPTYAPAAKVKMTLWEMIKKKGKVEPEFIKQCARIVFTECNACHRCSLYCPFGIDITFLIGIVRRICFLLGVVPYILMDYAYSLMTTLTQLWISQADWIDTAQWMEEETALEMEKICIPLNKEGAEVLYVPLGTEPKLVPQYIGIMAKIMNHSEVNWSYSLHDYAQASMFVQDQFTMQRIARAIFEEAINLRVKKIVATECGHAFYGTFVVAPTMLGYKELPFEALHAVEFYYELMRKGKLKVIKKIKEPVTIHEPCNLIRRKGAAEKFRYLINKTCEDFREPYPNREHNFCCGAGGGTIACGPPWKKERVRGYKVKAEQIKETGAKIVVAPCHNCHTQLHDLAKAYGLDIEVKFMWDILLETTDISH
jgi:Fe-S oxidoreductase